MESVLSPPPFLSGGTPLTPFSHSLSAKTILPRECTRARSSLPAAQPDPWSQRDHPSQPKPRSKNPKNPLSDDNARRIIRSKALYLSALRKNKGPNVHTPPWIKRTPEQMLLYLSDDRNGHLHGRHVVAAIRTVRALSQKKEGEYDIRKVMSGFVCKLTFREMCVVLKEQKGWRQVRDFFYWMKLQMSYRPSVIAYTIVLRIYGQVGKLSLAEETFLEMLEAGCEPDQVACGTMLCTYARWGRHRAMLSFLSAIEERGVTPSVSVFNFMLSSLQKKSLHTSVVELWRKMSSKGVAPNGFTYTVVVSSLVKGGYGDEALKTFYDMKNAGFIPEEVIYSHVISLCSKDDSRWDEAVALYHDMRSQKILPSNYTCASLLTIYYKSGDYSKALSLFSEMERYKIPPDEVIHGLLIRIYGKLGLYEDAERTFREVEHLGLLKDEKTYLAMAQVYLNSGNALNALNLIQLMKSRNILLSRFAYIVLLQCHLKREDLGSAEAIFLALSSTGQADAASCNDMLHAYINSGQMVKAIEFTFQIRKNREDYDEQLIKTIMRVYCRAGMVRDAEQFVEEMQTNSNLKDNRFVQTFLKKISGEYRGQKNDEGRVFASKTLDPVALGLMLTLYLGNDMSRSEEIFQLLIDSEGGPSAVSKLMTSLIKEGDISKADNLYGLSTKLGLQPEDEIVAALISLYGKEQRLDRAEEIFGEASSPFPAKVIVNAMIDLYIRSGRADDAFFLYTKASEQGDNLGVVAVSIIVNALSSNGKHQEAEVLIRKCMQETLELDTVAYNTFIKAMLEAGKLKFAASIHQQMLAKGIAPSIRTINTMISVYGRSRELNKAIEMVDIAHSFNLSLDEKAYMNLLRFCSRQGETEKATLLFSKMREEGIRPGKISSTMMMDLYASAGRWVEAADLFTDMKVAGIVPDSSVYLSLIRAYTNSSKTVEAEDIIKSMQSEGISPSSAHHNRVIWGYAKAGQIKEAERVYGETVSRSIGADPSCHRTMLRAYMDCGYVEEGIAQFERIREQVRMDRFIWSAAVHLYRSLGRTEEAEDVLKGLKREGIPFLANLEVAPKKTRS
ncbi:hypothetical protein MLD38_030320 [Melastoma candidum]|uniref:Uncharacterized protein n=1 Tax=Melastoma candidum TaxID=119954 RepID=A0ACB9MN64_9MYRT|nr:hypothetical protein MLD38_030320 [Melastoma candidum]